MYKRRGSTLKTSRLLWIRKRERSPPIPLFPKVLFVKSRKVVATTMAISDECLGTKQGREKGESNRMLRQSQLIPPCRVTMFGTQDEYNHHNIYIVYENHWKQIFLASHFMQRVSLSRMSSVQAAARRSSRHSLNIACPSSS